MRKILRKWLGIGEIDARLMFLETKPEPKNQTYLEPDDRRNLNYCIQILQGVLDHFDLDFRRELVPDLSRMREEPPMVDRITVFPRKVVERKPK